MPEKERGPEEREGQTRLWLTHLTTPQSVYHLRLGFGCCASKPMTSKWYWWLMWPVTWCSMVTAWDLWSNLNSLLTETPSTNSSYNHGSCHVILCMYVSYFCLSLAFCCMLKLISLQIILVICLKMAMIGYKQWFIEEAIFKANAKGIKVVSLRLLNQARAYNDSLDTCL